MLPLSPSSLPPLPVTYWREAELVLGDLAQQVFGIK